MRPILTRNRRDCIRQVWAVSGMVPSLRLPRRDGAGKQLVAARVPRGYAAKRGSPRASLGPSRCDFASRSVLALLSPLSHHLSNPGRRVATPIRLWLLRPEGTAVTQPRAAAFRRAPWVHVLHRTRRSSRRRCANPACSETEMRGTWPARAAGWRGLDRRTNSLEPAKESNHDSSHRKCEAKACSEQTTTMCV
jgi:hypothetical protein